MSPTARRARPADRDPLVPLLEALLRHYEEKAPQGLDAALDLLTAPPPFGPITLVAGRAGNLVGIAILNRLFPADDLGHALFLKDLFVAPAARRQGVGRALIQAAARLALAEGFCRIDWTADAGDPDLARFYRSLAPDRPHATFYRLTGAALEAAARSHEPGSAL